MSLTEYKRMQQRSGTYLAYENNIDSILPGEIVTVTQGCPDTSDGQAAFIKIGTNDPKRIVVADESTFTEGLTDELVASFKTHLSNYIKNSVRTEYPEWGEVDQVIYASSHSSLVEDNYIELDGNTFDPESDGLFIFRNSNDFIMREQYSFGVGTGLNDVRITFENSLSFTTADRLLLMIFHKDGSTGDTKVWRSWNALGLTPSDDDVRTDTITVQGTGVITDAGTSWGRNQRMLSWYDFSAALSDTTHIHVYEGGQLPPAILVPAGVSLSQKSTVLPAGFYVILGEDKLMMRGDGDGSTGGTLTNTAKRGFVTYVDTVRGTLSFNYAFASSTSTDITADGLKVSERKEFGQYPNNIATSHTMRFYVVEGSTSEMYYIGQLLNSGAEMAALVEEYAQWRFIPRADSQNS